LARQVGPSFRSRQLAMELRKLRMAAGLSQAEVAQAVGMSESKVGRQETAKIGIYLHDLHKLLDLYQVTDQRRVEIVGMARDAEDRGWIYVHGGKKLPEEWKTLIDFEIKASTILHYQPLVIPGLLQTSEYARTVIKATSLDLSESEIEALVNSRMARQTLLGRTNPAHLHAIIEENILACQFGDPKAVVRQLHHLLYAANQPNITIQVMPSSIGPHPGSNGSFVMLKYDHEPSLVLLENKISSLILDKEEQIEVYARIWTELQKLAYDAEKSVKLISVIATEVSRKN
jgi:transcriptional regulator with XRE-family HTH domain